MYVFLTVLAVLVSLLLVGIVVIQNSKGGGLAAGFSSSNQVMGVRKTTDFLEKATWYLAGTLVVLCVLTTLALPKETEVKSRVEAPAPVADPTMNAPFEIPMEESAPATTPDAE